MALKIYQIFERGIAYLLLAGMGIVVLLAAVSFGHSILVIFTGLSDPLDYTAFQVLFDRVLVVVIALELAHSIQQMAAGDHRLAQVRTVIVIGVLAVVRKLILLEVETTSGLFLVGLAATILALGLVLYLIGMIDRSERSPSPSQHRGD
ncbi:phosphate-starvation-inducible PsiE family protein [Fulvimarina sp. 2208YS6-2-32]|uniref:Phosphate-starvation-inducible PsiE family protein n=1 Tax=Fulvimarina uroteuthidis TaxID=3098149 RepID=A0ABU5I5J6_9HYPH|nr:phosphate-starvation-inducible PsiE family protein [Fulvimarina sp. 2208YS6-2-32]MDY8110645.1 phosphate-starvation-inducible PsiE family protein [Fulvimarina sp. 2208YS6-2-32]